MAIDRAQIGELIGRIFDRLDEQFDGNAEIADAMVLVEVVDHDDKVTLEDGKEYPATMVLLESTTNRVTVQLGILELARDSLAGGDE